MGEAMAAAHTSRPQQARRDRDGWRQPQIRPIPVQRLASAGPREGELQAQSPPGRQATAATPDAGGSEPCPQARRSHRHRWILGPLLPLLLLAGAVPAGQAAPWKDCSFNDRPIPCRDSHFADGSVRIVWQDGLAMTYRLIKPGFPVSILRDTLGGRWQREVLPQGNAVFVNPANGNRILVPLR